LTIFTHVDLSVTFFLQFTLNNKWKEDKDQAYKCFNENADDNVFMLVRFDGCRRLRRWRVADWYSYMLLQVKMKNVD